MTQKEKQKQINDIVLKAISDFNAQTLEPIKPKRLRTCSACVYTHGKYHVLQSYNTIIALIDTETDTLYDFLRYVYGYTATSAQHISKFDKDYCAGMWGCAHKYTYR